MCLVVEDRVFTGDTLLIGGDRPHRPAERRSRPALRQPVRQAAAISIRRSRSFRRTTTRAARTRPSAQEIADNPRLQKREREDFIEMMQSLNLTCPTHMTEALRTNMSGGKTVAQMLAEAAAEVPFMSLGRAECDGSPPRPNDLIVLDVRETRRLSRPAISRARASCRGGSWSCASTTSCPIRPCASWSAANSAASPPWPRDAAAAGLWPRRRAGRRVKAWREAGYPLQPGKQP